MDLFTPDPDDVLLSPNHSGNDLSSITEGAKDDVFTMSASESGISVSLLIVFIISVVCFYLSILWYTLAHVQMKVGSTGNMSETIDSSSSTPRGSTTYIGGGQALTTATDEPIHIINVGLRRDDNELLSDSVLSAKCYAFVQVCCEG